MDNSTRINSTLDDNKEEATVKEVEIFSNAIGVEKRWIQWRIQKTTQQTV